MTVSKQKYGEQLIKILNGGNYTHDSKITLRQAMLAISQARDKLVRDYLWNTRGGLDDFQYAGLLNPYTLTTKFDSVREKAYVSLPARPLWLPNNEGIFQVHFPQDEINSFIPVSNASMQIYGVLDSGYLEGNIGYYPERDRIIFYGLEDKDVEVIVKIIASAEDIGDLDFFPVPPDLENEMLQLAIQMLGVQKQQPQDTLNDNADA